MGRLQKQTNEFQLNQNVKKNVHFKVLFQPVLVNQVSHRKRRLILTQDHSINKDHYKQTWMFKFTDVETNHGHERI
jgi:hypothetical protein